MRSECVALLNMGRAGIWIGAPETLKLDDEQRRR
jgi:hypothetical protein